MGAYVIPAFQAEATIAAIVRALAPSAEMPVVVVNDGSTDNTALEAERAGAVVLEHAANLGKGAALETALRWADEHGHEKVVSLDADGQHPAEEAIRLMHHAASAETLLLGVRDLQAAGAPLANQRSNAFSNFVLSLMAGRRLLDTQCGLRRYPPASTLRLGAKARGFAFEADVVLRAARKGSPIIQVPCAVLYPEARTTHFDSVRDPARIVVRVVATWISTTHHRFFRRLAERAVLLAATLGLLLVLLHVSIGWAARVVPVKVDYDRRARVDVGPLRRVGPAQALRRQGIWEVFLTGTPAEVGYAHSTLMREEMVLTERSLLGSFAHYVPTSWARRLLVDVAMLQFRGLDRGMSTPRLQEIAAGASAFTPDPFATFLPTYQRFVYLNALYDISLSLEHSPLLGCTSFTARQSEAGSGPLLARVFDFEVHDVFDQQKAVFFVAEQGQLPLVSVAWPGLVGVVSGMNAAGVAMVVHGARGGEFVTLGEPVVHAVRRVLGQARTTEEALALFDRRPAMVSHLVVVQDALGHAARIERAPGRNATLIELGELGVVSNHFEGPLSADPKNLRVMRDTSTVARRARGDALIREHSGPITAVQLAAWLRDRKDAHGRELEVGDRHAIDADIATHAVIMDTATRTLWVNQGPHLRGEFVRYDLPEIFAGSALPPSGVLRPTLPHGD
jgi:isopenicillin-N N-acyltransferase-like protein